MIRNYLSGTQGDVINTLLAATGFNMMNMLRRIKAETIAWSQNLHGTVVHYMNIKIWSRENQWVFQAYLITRRHLEYLPFLAGNIIKGSFRVSWSGWLFKLHFFNGWTLTHKSIATTRMWHLYGRQQFSSEAFNNFFYFYNSGIYLFWLLICRINTINFQMLC